MKMDSEGRIVEKILNHNHEPDSEKSLMREKVTNGCNKLQATIGHFLCDMWSGMRKIFEGRKVECV